MVTCITMQCSSISQYVFFFSKTRSNIFYYDIFWDNIKSHKMCYFYSLLFIKAASDKNFHCDFKTLKKYSITTFVPYILFYKLYCWSYTHIFELFLQPNARQITSLYPKQKGRIWEKKNVFTHFKFTLKSYGQLCSIQDKKTTLPPSSYKFLLFSFIYFVFGRSEQRIYHCIYRRLASLPFRCHHFSTAIHLWACCQATPDTLEMQSECRSCHSTLLRCTLNVILL